jgi:hypothetical protein
MFNLSYIFHHYPNSQYAYQKKTPQANASGVFSIHINLDISADLPHASSHTLCQRRFQGWVYINLILLQPKKTTIEIRKNVFSITKLVISLRCFHNDTIV